MSKTSIKILSSIAFILFLSMLLPSCSSSESNLPGLEFGEAIEYDDFLFFSGRKDTLKRAFTYQFNDWAESKSSSVKFKLSSSSGNNSDVNFLIDGKPFENGTFTLNPKNKLDTVEISMFFSSNSKNDFYEGEMIALSSSQIDRVNDSEIKGQETSLFYWSGYSVKKQHPVLLGLKLFLLLILIVLFIWFFFLKRMVYPSFKGKIKFVFETPISKIIKLKGTRKLCFTKNGKQTFLNKVFTGRIIFDSSFKEEFEVSPSPRFKNKLEIRSSEHVSIEPYTRYLERGNNYTVKVNNQEFKITIL